MTVLNTARWDKEVRQWGMTGGPSYSTMVVTLQSGHEQRSKLWTQPLGSWNLGDRAMKRAQYQELLSFFHFCQGKFYGFRVHDWTDCNDDNVGVLGNGAGDLTNLTATYQMNKARTIANTPGAFYQKITRPIGPTFSAIPELGNTVDIFWNGDLVPQGVGPGSCTVNDSNGLVVFNPYSYALSSSAGNTVSLSGPASPSLQVNQWVQLTGHTTSTGVQIFQISAIINSTTIQLANYNETFSGPAQLLVVPGPSDVLKWTGSYDYPARFTSDDMNTAVADTYLEQGPTNNNPDVWVTLSAVPVTQIRE